MDFPTIPPSDVLKPYIKYYWVCTSDEDVSKEVMFPSGYLELCVDVSNGHTVRFLGDRSIKMPGFEVLGHLTVPTQATVTKGTTVLITRFYPYASALFFPCHVSSFTNESVDLHDVISKESTEFYNRLMEQRSLAEKIKMLDTFLIQRLAMNKKSHQTLKLVESMCTNVYAMRESFSIENLALRYGFSARYIQKLFLEFVGLTPQRFFSVQRFNKSLELIQTSHMSFTSVALECGYYDQAHFIKEFKSYTGLTPSQVLHSSDR
jgi:AraC-like DNA-binding protein